MPSPIPTPSLRPLGLSLVIALIALVFVVDMADWKVVLLSVLASLSLASAALFWIRRTLGRRATESFVSLGGLSDVSTGSALPALPDDWPEAGAAARSLSKRFDGLQREIGLLSAQACLLRSTYESLPEGFIAMDGAERIFAMNASARRMLGLSDADFSGRQLAEVVRVPALHQAVGECRRKRLPILRELRLGERASRVLNAHCGWIPEGGGVVILFTDITFLSRTEEFRRDFVSNVSHELRTPVTSIQGYAETLLDTPDLDDQTRQKFIEVISRQAVRLNHIIEDILELSRLEHDASGFVFEESHLYPILQSALETCTARAKEKSITLRLNAPTALLAEVNASLLEQALTNLVTNAIKYSPDSREVLVTCSLEGERVHISVKDNGIGISPEHLPRLFERFYRVDKARSRSVGGTGLGLAIVRQVALLHVGTVSVASVPGEGSAFTIVFPMRRPPDQISEL